MKFDGVVCKIEETIFLFILEGDEIHDGINISDHQNIYSTLEDNHLVVVDIILKDGTMELDDVNINEFIHGDTYDIYDVFIHLKDIGEYEIGEDLLNEGMSNVEDVIHNGKFADFVYGCVSDSKEEAVKLITEELEELVNKENEK